MPTSKLWFLNTLVTIRVSAEEGNDGISVIENLLPHGDSPPLHPPHPGRDLPRP